MTRPDTGVAGYLSGQDDAADDIRPGQQAGEADGWATLEASVRQYRPLTDAPAVRGADWQPAHGRKREKPGRFGVPDLGVGLFFLIAAYLMTSAMWKSPSTLTPTANSTDQAFFEFMLEHAVRIFTHGDNPLLVTQLNAPAGVNVMTNTGLLGLSIPLAPLTALVGPAAVFVLIIMLGLAGTAFAWYWVLARHFVHNRLGAFVGGAICGFGPAIMTHANGHPNLTAQFVLPFILARAMNLRTSTRPIRDGSILGLLVAYQMFLNEELLFLAGLGGVLFVLLYAAFRPSIVRRSIGPMATGLGMGLVVAAVIMAYPLWFQFKGPQHFSGLPDFLRAYPYRLPLNSWVSYPSLSFHTILNPYPTGTEQNSFLGWWMVIISVVIVLALAWKHPAVRALGLVGVFFAWASLGDQVVTTNVKKSYPVSLWDHLSHLPLFDSVLAGRLAMVVLPVIGALFAIAVTDCADAISAAARTRMDTFAPIARMTVGMVGLVAIIACAITITPSRVPVSPRLGKPVPTFFTSGQWRSYVPAGDTVLSATPYDTIQFMEWSIAAKLDFGVPGGYFLGPAKLLPGQKTPTGQYGPQWLTTMLVLGSIGSGTWQLPVDISGYQSAMVSDLRYWHAAIIVLTGDEPHYIDERNALTRLLGDPGEQVGDVWLWDVRSITDPSPTANAAK